MNTDIDSWNKRMAKRVISLLIIALLVSLVPMAQLQEGSPAISLTLNAGYDGLFRENEWFPLRVQISNDGADVAGRVVVRPERAGNAFTNTFSVPVDMPAGSRKSVFLYVTARSYATEVRVEFLDDSGISLAEQANPLRNVLYQDQLHVVLTQASAGSVDLTSVRSGGYNAYQSNWLIENIPDRAAALDAVDTLLFTDIDTGPLTTAQQQALADWVAEGGHLIVTGGTNWQATAAGLTDLLPLMPDGSDTESNLDSLGALAGAGELQGETIIATGTLADDARVLAETEASVPLVARHTLGLGTVDYLAVDPLAQPLRDWTGLNDLWFMLTSTLPPQPSWTRDLVEIDRAANAVEVLPGLNLLPDVLPLCGFLAAYVALIGPLNYVVLNRINRREWAWLTMPIFILLFSGLAWAVGFNLRGNTATISRLAVVESWPDVERAQVSGLVGLLSPRRTDYTLMMTDGSLLRPMARTIQANPFAASVQSSTDIQQADSFRADNFTVDASFIATFSTSSTIDRPDISGQASLFYEPARLDETTGHWAVRGSVRNNSQETISNPVILARGASLALEAALEPGDIQTFEMPLIPDGQVPAAPSVLERSTDSTSSILAFNRFSRDTTASEQTIRDIINTNLYSSRLYTTAPGNTAEEQENFRRQYFLSSFMQDHYLSTARGNGVYLAGWSDRMPLETELDGAAWAALDTTLHLVELEVEIVPPTGRVVIGPELFTWVARERVGLTINSAPVNAALQPGEEATFQFTPLPDAVLSRVDALNIELNMGTTSRFEVPVEVWNWQAQAWDVIELEPMQDRTSVRRQSIDDPEMYLGVDNTVRVRLTVDETLGFLRILRLAVEHEGQY